ncbi:MAG: hypothetical protein ACXVI9_02740 [Mucilaginibacter sp.]
MRVIEKQRLVALLILIISFISQSVLFGQTETRGYQKALKYILNDNKGKNILISDTITHLSYFSFGEQIDTVWGTNSNITSHILDSVDHARENYKSVLVQFKGTRLGAITSAYIIFFSDFYSNMVIGEIMPLKSKRHIYSHHAQSLFNKADRYLFVFDKNYSLKKVFKTTAFYE